MLYYGALKIQRDTLPVMILLVASIAFYGFWQVSYLGILFASILWNFLLGQQIISLRANKKMQLASRIMSIGVAGDLALLGYFKYTDFALSNLQQILGTHWATASIVLPLGISFYTFTQIAYLVDANRDKVSGSSFSKYALFVTYFPHLIAGPILHHKDMISQFNWTHLRRDQVIRNVYIGTLIFVMGLFKKVAIADPLASIANAGYASAGSLNFIDGWVTSLSYTFQLFFDFSGYSDMAVGLALIMQIRLPVNFNTPYLAKNIQDFWRRWHITLSNFLRDYLYIPLGGSKKGELTTLRNLFITFVLGGLWHGAGWTFIVWGALHGFGLILHRGWMKTKIIIPKWAALACTFLFVNAAWVYFRADNIAQAHQVLRSMFNIKHMIHRSQLINIDKLVSQYTVDGQIPLISSTGYACLSALIAGFFAVYFTFNNVDKTAYKTKPGAISGLLFAILTILVLFKLDRTTQFLYFNF